MQSFHNERWKSGLAASGSDATSYLKKVEVVLSADVLAIHAARAGTQAARAGTVAARTTAS
jgi:hypothetical protein